MKFEEIIRLADSGDTDAMVKAIQEFVWNEHVPVEDTPEMREKLVEYMNKAINAGNTDAMNQLGAMYAEGRGVIEDPEKAFLFYKMASDCGHNLATSNLGFCYLYGNGTEQDYEEAYKAFSKASMFGIGDAVVRLGDMYLNGFYVNKDECAAYELYLKAADMALRDLNDWGNQQIYSDALTRLGYCSYNGIVTGKTDIAEALKFYADAFYYYDIREKKGDAYSAHGYEESKKMLKKIVGEL